MRFRKFQLICQSQLKKQPLDAFLFILQGFERGGTSDPTWDQTRTKTTTMNNQQRRQQQQRQQRKQQEI